MSPFIIYAYSEQNELNDDELKNYWPSTPASTILTIQPRHAHPGRALRHTLRYGWWQVELGAQRAARSDETLCAASCDGTAGGSNVQVIINTISRHGDILFFFCSLFYKTISARAAHGAAQEQNIQNS